MEDWGRFALPRLRNPTLLLVESILGILATLMTRWVRWLLIGRSAIVRVSLRLNT